MLSKFFVFFELTHEPVSRVDGEHEKVSRSITMSDCEIAFFEISMTFLFSSSKKHLMDRFVLWDLIVHAKDQSMQHPTHQTFWDELKKARRIN